MTASRPLEIFIEFVPYLPGPRTPPPRHGSSPALHVYGGAQRAISLATGFLTGESTGNPPAETKADFSFNIKWLEIFSAGVGGSHREATLAKSKREEAT